MFSFGHPWAFLLVLPWVVACGFVYRRGIRSGLLFAPLGRVPSSRPTWRTTVALVLPGVVLAGLAAGILALARPRTVFSRDTRRTEAIAIQMVVDMSGSMEALDLTRGELTRSNYQTRLDVVKETFEAFVKRRPDDLIGLVTFGGFAATRCPLTADHEALLHVLKGVEIPVQGMVDNEELATAIGDGLATACARIENVEPVSKIVVLLSDGESNAGIIEPPDAIRIAKKLGVKVYTIGVGSNRGRTWVRVRDSYGREDFVPADFRLDERLLQQIASETGGEYFQVQDAAGLEKAMATIDELEKTEIERDVYYEYDEWFPAFLLVALGLVVTGTGLNMLVARRVV